jgi:hypothetical protein
MSADRLFATRRAFYVVVRREMDRNRLVLALNHYLILRNNESATARKSLRRVLRVSAAQKIATWSNATGCQIYDRCFRFPHDNPATS